MGQSKHNNMSFLEHLEELRWHVIRSIYAVIICAFVCFLFPEVIFNVILMGPYDLGNFPTYNFLCNAGTYIGLETGFCGESFPNYDVINRTGYGQFMSHFSSSIYLGIILSFPYIIFQIWRFIAPGLLSNEKIKSGILISSSSSLFGIGVLFGYYVILPLSLNFLLNYSLSESISNQLDLSNIISTSLTIPLATGIAFQLPIVIYFLSKAGIVDSKSLIKYRRYTILIVLIIAALATPPDIFSQILLSIPILILYQIGIFISRIIEKRRLK